jgi:small subunit ribosomal protein S21
MQREGIFREMKLRCHYEKPSEKKTREKAEAIRRARKLARKKMQREGLLSMKPRVVPGAPGRGGPARGPRPRIARELIGSGSGRLLASSKAVKAKGAGRVL